MPRCRNPECRNGQTPGVVITGKGTKTHPILGQRMSWGWVACPACTPNKDSGPFKLIKRSPDEIAQRADLATRRATYAPSPANALGSVRAAVPTSPAPATAANGQASSPVSPPAADGAAILGMTQALNRLLEENATLRAENTRLKQENAQKDLQLAELTPAEQEDSAAPSLAS